MSDKLEQPISMRIKEIKEESPDTKTFTFEYDLGAEPGQFLMAWLPRIDQKPFGVSFQDKKTFSILVQKVGPFTEELFKKKVGDFVGIQGPYGFPFSCKGKSVALVAGGFGAAPLAFLADVMKNQGAKVNFIIGARTGDMVVYKDRFKDLVACTDDGSCGKEGFATDALKDILETEKIDHIYTCGPEIMMAKVIDLSDEFKIPCEASLERYMKCGFGVCGQCCIDPVGLCVCKDGPVFEKEKIREFTEFNRYHRDGTGTRHDFKKT